MSRVSTIILGVALIILGVVGLQSQPTTHWLMWLDIVVGLVSFFGTFAMLDLVQAPGRVGTATALAVVLYVLWIVGLVTRAVTWQSWWTFAFACAYLAAAVSAGEQRAAERRSRVPDLELRKRA